jgi:hypothetical protein
MSHIHKTAKISLIFAVQLILPSHPSDFVSIGPTNITLHKIRRKDRKIPISKLVRKTGKIGQTAWQNRLDVTKIGSVTVPVNEL